MRKNKTWRGKHDFLFTAKDRQETRLRKLFKETKKENKVKENKVKRGSNRRQKKRKKISDYKGLKKGEDRKKRWD